MRVVGRRRRDCEGGRCVEGWRGVVGGGSDVGASAVGCGVRLRVPTASNLMPTSLDLKHVFFDRKGHSELNRRPKA